MPKTILITGSSSGIGEAAVRLFARRGWQVIATSRRPDKKAFKDLNNVVCCRLDVTDERSIKTAFKLGQEKFGKIDVILNNAGFAVSGIFEAIDDDLIKQQFETNLFGLMRVTREAINHMRPSGGIIIQVSSMGGRVSFPLYSIYHSSKWALEGFSESLQYELLDQNIRIKIIEPGVIKTAFYGKNRQFIKPPKEYGYDNFLAKTASQDTQSSHSGQSPDLVAKTIYKAATDNKSRLRYPVARPAPQLLMARKILPESLFFFIIRKFYKL